MELIDLILIWIQKVINEMVFISSDVTRLIRSGVDSTRIVKLDIALLQFSCVLRFKYKLVRPPR
jgi:hypothetical protein